MTWCLDCVRALITAAAMGALESQVRRGFRHKKLGRPNCMRVDRYASTQLILESNCVFPAASRGKGGKVGAVRGRRVVRSQRQSCADEDRCATCGTAGLHLV